MEFPRDQGTFPKKGPQLLGPALLNLVWEHLGAESSALCGSEDRVVAVWGPKEDTAIPQRGLKTSGPLD